MIRHQTEYDFSFEEKLAQEARLLREQANRLPICQEREELLRQARHADTASHMTEWLSCVGLQPPK
jgi:hypothetical protein